MKLELTIIRVYNEISLVTGRQTHKVCVDLLGREVVLDVSEEVFLSILTRYAADPVEPSRSLQEERASAHAPVTVEEVPALPEPRQEASPTFNPPSASPTPDQLRKRARESARRPIDDTGFEQG